MNETDLTRRENHREKILRMLRDAAPNWVTCSAFAAFSRNHTARISELRNDGHDIRYRVADEETGATEYRLVGGCEKKDKSVKVDVEVIGLDPDDPSQVEPRVQYKFTCDGERVGQTGLRLKFPKDVTIYASDEINLTWRF